MTSPPPPLQIYNLAMPPYHLDLLLYQSLVRIQQLVDLTFHHLLFGKETCMLLKRKTYNQLAKYDTHVKHDTLLIDTFQHSQLSYIDLNHLCTVEILYFKKYLQKMRNVL